MEKNKKPPWWNFVARHDYNLLRKSYHEVQSRILPKDEAEKFDEVQIPYEWRTQPLSWFMRAFGKKELPRGSGCGFVQSPFSDIFRMSLSHRMETLGCTGSRPWFFGILIKGFQLTG